ncbi:MAG: hypothetical protein JWM21_6 [Acidobacteria bacterium]|nr:hypothetical protein [Acidobacteriota bacterium]
MGNLRIFRSIFFFLLACTSAFAQTRTEPEYLWYEAENMRGFSTDTLHEPLLNPWYLNLPKSKVPGWAMNGPGVSAEWTQGGESEWNSAAAGADETKATIYQDLEIPRGGEYRIWVRYADWANQSESFTIKVTQQGKEVFRHEFGSKDVVDPHDEISMYWGWAFTWDGAAATLDKGSARLSIEIEKAAGARRHVDCVLLTNDLTFTPSGRSKPDFAAMRYLRDWTTSHVSLLPLLEEQTMTSVPEPWRRPKVAGRDFLMPWNIAKEFWPLYDKPAAERPVYPFNAEPIEEFVKKYSGAREVPIFDSKLVVPVIYLNNLPEYLKEGSHFLRYLRETHVPFVVLINYGAAEFSPADGQAAFKLLTGELRDQFLGWISGESVGFVWDHAPQELKITPEMSRRQLLEAHRVFYTNAIARKWAETFHTQTGPMWDKMIPAQSTSSTSFAHALTDWGVRLIGMETAAVQPMTAMRIAFTRGAARQYGGAFLYYHAPNFGDSATTFTKAQNFAGPDNFFHSRYGATMGPSLSWYRKSYYLYYMSGASAIYLEQGFDQFFKPGPGDQPFQLNPLGRITHEFMNFAEKHPDRGTPYTPIAFLLDPAHGFEMTDYPQWPFELSQINRSDRALRELFGVAYYPGTVLEGEPATADRQAFVSSAFGDIFDVIVAPGTAGILPASTNAAAKPALNNSPLDALNSYRALVVGGTIEWSKEWTQRLTDYVRKGGVVVLNSAQIKGLSAELLGVRLLGVKDEAHNARCLAQGEPPQDLSGQIFRYERVATSGSEVLMAVPTGDPLVTVNKVGRGKLVFVALPDLLGEDERVTPFAAHLLAHVFSEATPVAVDGDVEHLINRTEHGWVITLINNNGVMKPQQGMAQVDRRAVVTATVALRGQIIQSAREWTDDRSLEVNKQGKVTVSIPPGGIAIVELSTR